MNEELQPIFNQYKSVNPNITEAMFTETYNSFGPEYLDTIQNEIQEQLKKKVDSTGSDQPVIPDVITEQLSGEPINQVDPRFEQTVTQQISPIESSTVLDFTSEQPLLASDSILPSSPEINLERTSEPVLKPIQVAPAFIDKNITSNNTLNFLAGKDDTPSKPTSLGFKELTPDQIDLETKSQSKKDQETTDFLKQYSDKDYLNKIPFVEKGIEYTAWVTSPTDVEQSNNNLSELEKRGDIVIKGVDEKTGNYKYEILSDSYKDTFNNYINDLNTTAGEENIDRARFNQGNVGNTPPKSESVEYLNQLQKEYGVLLTEDQIQQLGSPETRKQLEINLETERRLKENPDLDYNIVLQQVTSEKQGLSEQQKLSIGNSYVRDMFLGTPDNFLEDEKDEYRLYQQYFNNPENVAEFGDFMNDTGKAMFDSSWIKSNQTKKEQSRRKEMFETFLAWKGKNDRLDLEINQRSYEDADAKAKKYRDENNVDGYQTEVEKMNGYLSSYNNANDRLNSRIQEYNSIQNNFSKTQKTQKEREEFQLRVQNGETSANVQNIVGNVVLGAGTSVQNAVTGLLRIASVPLGKGNVNDAIDILSEPISIGNVDIARISDKVVNYKSGNKNYKEVNGTLYGVNSDGTLYRPTSDVSKNNLQKVDEDVEYNASGIAFVTSKMLADILITQKVGGQIGASVSSLSNAIANSKKIASVFGEASQLSKLASSYARLVQSPTSAMVNGWTVQMYNDNYLAAKNGGIESEVNRNLYALTTSYVLALIQKVNPDTNFLKTINSEQKAIVSALMENNTQKALLGIQSFTKKALVNTSKELVEENIQQLTQDFTNILVNTVGNKNLQVSDVQDYKDVFVGTVIPSIVASGLGGRVNQAEVGDRKIDLTSLTRNELITELARTNEGLSLLEDFRDNAFFDSQENEANKIIGEVIERQKYIKKIPDVENYSTEAVNEILPLLQNIDDKKKALSVADDTFKNRINLEIDSISNEINTILDNDQTTQPTQEQETIQEQAPVSIEETAIQEQATEKLTNQYSLENMRSLPFISQGSEDLFNESMDILSNVDWNNSNEVKSTVSRILDLIANKPIPENKINQFLESKEKFINSKDYYTKDYLEKYLNLTLRDFSAQPEISQVNVSDDINAINNQRQAEIDALPILPLNVNDDPELQQRINDRESEIARINAKYDSQINKINNQNETEEIITQQTTSEASIEPRNQANEAIENIQPTQGESAKTTQVVQIDETTFNDEAPTTEEEINKSSQQLSDAISLFESFNEPTSTTETATSRVSDNGKYNVVENVAKDGSTTFDLLDINDNPVTLTNKQKDVYVAEYINSKKYPETDINIQENMQPDEVVREIINKTVNPKELAEIIVSTPQFDTQSVVGSKDWSIAQVIGSNNVSRDSFIENDDINNITNAIGRTYFGKNKTGKSIDTIAQEASEQFSGDYSSNSITTQDIVDFIKQYPNDPSKAERPNNTLYDDAVSKFISLTGQNPTKNILDKILPSKSVQNDTLNLNLAETEYNNLSSQEQNQLSQEYDNWFNNLSEEQKLEELNKTYPDYEQDNRQDNIQSQIESAPISQRERDQNVSDQESTERVQRQQSTDRLTTIPEEAFNSLIEQLKKPFKNAFKNLNVTTNLEEATSRARELGEDVSDLEFTNNNGNIYGFKLSDGTIYINPENLNANTPIHEFSHLWEQMMPNAWKKGLETFKETATGKRLFNKLKSDGNYSNLTDDQIWSEALNTHIGNYGEWKNNNPKGKMKEFADWIKRTFAKIGNYFGIKTNPETTLQNFTEKVTGELLGGQELVSESDQQTRQNVELKKYLKDKLKLPQNLVDALPKDLSVSYKILMGDNSMSLNDRISQTKLASAETAFNDIEFSKTTGNILVGGIGNIRANLLSTFKYYITGSNRINSDIFHELVHAGTLLTMKDMELYKSSPKYQSTNKYTPEQMEAYNNILFNSEYFRDLYNEGRKRKPFGTSIYGLENEYEFVAEFMSNPKFKEWILDNSNEAKAQAKDTRKGNILSNLWNDIKTFLGVNDKQFDNELENEINNDINTILDAQRNNLENFVSFTSDINQGASGIQFSKGDNLNRNVIPKTIFAKIVNATSTNGKQSGFDELVKSSWFKGLSENIKSQINADNFHNLMLDQARLIQENDAIRRSEIRSQAREKAKEQVKKVKQEAKEQISSIIDKYKTRISEIKADSKKTSREKSLDQKRSLRTAVKDIKSYLSSNMFVGKITPAETNRLIRKASEIGTRSDISVAVNEFTKLYDEIRNKAESRLKQKEFTLDEYNEIKPLIQSMMENGDSLNTIKESIKKEKLSNKRSGVLNETYENQIQNIYDSINNENLTPEQAYDQMKSQQDKVLESMRDKRTKREKIKSATRNFIKYVSDRQYLPKKLLQEIGANNTVNRMITMAGASSRASNIFSKLDEKIFKGLKQDDKFYLNAMIVAKRILAIEKNRNERGLPPIKHPYSNPKKALEEMRNKIGDAKFSDLENRSNEYFKAFKDILGDMRDNGLISQESYESMVEIDYQPRIFIDRLLNAEGNLDEDGNYQNFSGQNGGLKSEITKRLSEGSDSAIIDDAEWLLKTALSSRYKAMAMNKVNRRFMTDEFWKAKDRFDQIDPKNFENKADKKFYEYFNELRKMIKDNPIIGSTESGNPKYQYESTPQGFKKAYYYVDGVRNEFFLAEQFHQEWHDVKEGLIFDPQAKGLINKWSGAGLIKAMATGYNPTFAFTNTPRDFMQTLVFSPEYSNNLLIGTLQLGYDQVKAITRMYKSDFQGKEDDIFQKYIEYGGGMDFLHVQGLLDSEQKTSKAIQKVLDSNIFQVATLMKLSQWSEMMTRMAIFERSIQNQLKNLGLKSLDQVSENERDDIYYQAVASARSIMDFNQGGKLTKDLDAVMPYLNAATQGTRVAVDSFRRDPAGTSVRMFQAGGLMASTAIGVSYALLAMARQMGDDDDDKDKSINEIILNSYDGLSQYQRANYINIILPSKNDKGERHVFKIAKTQFVAPLSYMMEEGLLGVIRKIEGKPEKDFTKVIQETGWVANKNMTPIEFAKPQDFITSVATKNPLMKASLTYVTGYDFFKDEVITFDIKKSNFPKELEGYKDTNVEDFYKGIGELTGGSPARTKAFVESIVTTPETNPFVTMMYGGADLTNAIIQGDSKTEVAKEVKDNIAKVFTKRLIGQASDFNRMRREREDVEKEVNKAILQDEKVKIETDILAKKFIDGKVNEQDIANKFNEMKLKDQSLDKAYKRLEDKILNKASDTRMYDIKYSTSNSNVAKAILIKQYFPEVYENSVEGNAIKAELKELKIYSKDVQQELLNIKENE